MKPGVYLFFVSIMIYGCIGNNRAKEMKEISRHKFVLVILGEDDNGEEEGLVAPGKLVYNDTDNTVSVFKEGVTEPAFILEEEEFDQIEKVNGEEIKDGLLDAEYMMVLHIKPLPDNADSLRPAGARTLPFKYPGHDTGGE